MGPSAIDVELRLLASEMGGSTELIGKFLKFILTRLASKTDFEILNAYLSLLLRIHSEKISQEIELITLLEEIKEIQSTAWLNLKNRLNKNVCLTSYLKSVT